MLFPIPFIHSPSKIILKNNKSALIHSDFVITAINELLTSGCIHEIYEERAYVVNPLTVSVNATGKKRLVLDLRHVNQFVEKQKVKFEGVNEALQYANQGKHMIKFDLKSGYHHIDIHPDFHKFLGFSWKFGDKTKYFEFNVLPFGLSSAGHIFTKVVRVLVKYWRSRGIPVIVYLDDGWVCDTLEKCKSASDLIQDTLRRSGFVVNIEKSVFDPTNKLVWLGFVWNLQYGRLEVPVQKLDDIKYIASNLLEKKGDITARKLSSFVGKIIALKPSFGNICQLMTRRLSISICCRESWDKKLTIDNENVQELEFWRHNINRLSFNRFMCIDKMPEKIIFSDASCYAGAGFTCERSKKVVHYMWDDIEKCKSST